ncbi:MAG: hypothetical protein WC642_13120, partial [Nocardioides sp.]
LKALAAVDPRSAGRAVLASSNVLAETLIDPHAEDLADIGSFIQAADAVDPEILNTLLSNVDPTAEEPWRRRLADSPDQARLLMRRAQLVGGRIGALADRLLATET